MTRIYIPGDSGALAVGAGEIGGRLRETALGVPDDVGFQLVALAPELQLPIDDKMLPAQDVKGFVRRADIGRSFLDNAAHRFKAFQRGFADV